MQYVICPTYTCNFRCPYCFESHSLHEKITALTEEQLQAVMQAIDIFHKESGYKIGMINLLEANHSFLLLKNSQTNL